MTFSSLGLLSFLLSASLAFFTTAIVVHCLIYCFRIQKRRVRYFLRLVPFIGIVLDFLVLEYSLSSWINPLSCISCVQKIFLNLFFSDLQEYLNANQISLMTYLSDKDPYYLGFVFSTLFVCSSILFIFHAVLQLFLSKRYVQSLVHTGSESTRLITNSDLQSAIALRKTKIVVSKNVHIPMAASVNAILIPPEMEQLSQNEFEAVIAHEFEHIFWKDPQLKSCISVFSSLFWWIPLKSWVIRLEEEQEMSADQAISRYMISTESLASALVKVAVQAKGKKAMHFCYLADQEHSVLKRIKAIVHSYPREKFTGMEALVIFSGGLFALLCMLK